MQSPATQAIDVVSGILYRWNTLRGVEGIARGSKLYLLSMSCTWRTLFTTEHDMMRVWDRVGIDYDIEVFISMVGEFILTVDWQYRKEELCALLSHAIADVPLGVGVSPTIQRLSCDQPTIHKKLLEAPWMAFLYLVQFVDVSTIVPDQGKVGK